MFLSKKTAIVPFLLLLFLAGSVEAQQTRYWQQELDYQIDVTLDDRQHSLDGTLHLKYTNHSSDTLRFIWFHVWPNAYKNDRTAFTDQQLENGSTRFYFSDEEERGYLNRLNFQVDDVTADLEDHPSYIDIVKLLLPTPLAPGGTASIQTSFHVQLPAIFSRSGHADQHYQIAQWYPRPAVYDRNGWHPMPYLDQGEFYGEFGRFDVRITLPENYVVAAPGKLLNEEEEKWLAARDNFSFVPKKQKIKTKAGGIKVITEKTPPSAARTKTLHYQLKQAHDFAWFADKRFVVKQQDCLLPSGKTVKLQAFYLPGDSAAWQHTLRYASEGLKKRSEWIGDYPYDQFSIVESAVSTGGGMEYPGITLISSELKGPLLEYAVTHEAGHNWFQAALGSNEREWPWLDEGLNTFYDNRYSRAKPDSSGELSIFGGMASLAEAMELLVENAEQTHTAQPIGLSGEAFSATNYNLMAYSKAAQWLEALEDSLGTALFDQCLRTYYQRWKFKHPTPIDFQQVCEEVSGRSLAAHFQKLQDPHARFSPPRRGFRAGFLFSKNNLRQTFRGHAAHTLLISPIVGYNKYDQFMVGALLTNITLPVPRFQYLFTPMYATGSQSLSGLGLVNYSVYPAGGRFARIDIGVSAARFHIGQFTDPDEKDWRFGMDKLVPGIRLTLREAGARSTRERFVQFKSHFFREEGLSFRRDTVIVGLDTTLVNRYGKQSNHRSLQQLRLVWQDYRALYPYRAELKLEQGRDFVRVAFTGNYFFNYAKGGGLHVRFFAGKFLYTGGKTFTKQFDTDRYHLNLTGANGYEDYTYSDYFVGRNEFDGWMSQQIMERDGGFKTRTDLLAAKVGRSDDWLMAMNFSTTVPDRMNPLSLLPVKIPLKIFADIGTYAGAWDRNANTDRFLFDAGLQLSLLKETVHIYLPLVYSQPFKEYIQSTIPKKERLLRKISFSIDISNFQFRKINRNLGF